MERIPFPIPKIITPKEAIFELNSSNKSPKRIAIDEIMAVFEKLSKNHPDKNIEIEVRPTFMYKTMTFTVKCEGEEISLEKTVVKMYKN